MQKVLFTANVFFSFSGAVSNLPDGMRSARGELGVTEYILEAGCSISKRLPRIKKDSFVLLLHNSYLRAFLKWAQPCSQTSISLAQLMENTLVSRLVKTSLKARYGGTLLQSQHPRS